jgi:hypothetical protein
MARVPRHRVLSRITGVLFAGWALACHGTAVDSSDCTSAACAVDPEYDRIRDYERGGVMPASPRAMISAPVCADISCNVVDAHAEEIHEFERGNDVADRPPPQRGPSHATSTAAMSAQSAQAAAPAQAVTAPTHDGDDGRDWLWRGLVAASVMVGTALLLRPRRR